jgi:hypothetical protein
VHHLFDGDSEDASAARKGKGKRNVADAKKSLRMSMKKAAKQEAKAKKTTVGADFKVQRRAVITHAGPARPHSGCGSGFPRGSDGGDEPCRASLCALHQAQPSKDSRQF